MLSCIFVLRRGMMRIPKDTVIYKSSIVGDYRVAASPSYEGCVHPFVRVPGKSG